MTAELLFLVRVKIGSWIMQKHKIYPVLLAGGSGTRLWPMSRKSFPKQFYKFLDSYSLFQHSALRFKSGGDVSFYAPVVVTNNDFRFIVMGQLDEIGVEPDSILIEPEAKNTAPAILAAVEHIRTRDPEALILVTPSDHLLPDVSTFLECISKGVSAAQAGNLVTFAVSPSRPETGYGYIQCAFDDASSAVKIKSFVEKPDQERAISYLESADYYWNSGIFLFRACDLHEAISHHCPDVMEPVCSSFKNSELDLDFVRLSPSDWSRCPDISIDYAVMEASDNVCAVRFGGDWSDLGDWSAMWQSSKPHTNGVSEHGSVTSLDCSMSLLRSEDPNVHLVGLGLENIIAVAAYDAVLVASMDRCQDVKHLVAELRAKKIKQADASPKDHRPWGWFESLALGERFQVKKIYVNPGAALSLQSHHHRSEHWIVVEGTAKVTINDEVRLVTEGQSIYIPLGAKHRMENPGKLPMILVEVQTGGYLEEDDIVRYEDRYSRK